MGRFSIKQLMGSTALVAAGLWATLQVAVSPFREPWSLALMLLPMPLFFSAFYNLSGRPLYGAAHGVLVMIVAVLIPLVWLILRSF